ncbi:MAG: hydroxyphenylacetyl-CoA thioesterase PaaI [Casimicrobiaceae bacterium]|nr:hydroxyphenylacetyl-CoA thioesterase PaaI [Casimicrobiaceae bacterium]MCX8098224.1 hydroxyphenylacetyl-CoA thioesterase PaaI [Casimicrobiaceae bacterium]MDW8311292.1 hydroxyphenylacetyl-CoA thioesterase PaaI [Burkholderiales bacterium]
MPSVDEHPAPRTVAEAMYAKDRVAQALAIEIEEVRHGYARLSMRVRPDMVNGHALCHGGYLALLCDTAFAYACNSYNAVTVASGFSIELIAPAREGERLTAEAVEVIRRGRSGLYDIRLTNERGETIALFRGKSRTIDGQIVAVPDPR